MKNFLIILCLIFLTFGFKEIDQKNKSNPPIYIAFLWHMHQPIYWPYESIVTTENNNRYSYSVFDIHNQRTGPYTSWPKNAVQKGIVAGLPHFGAQVSFSGSLVENLNNLESHGNFNFQNWKTHWNNIKNQFTVLGNPRIDMVGFGYHHPLMGLIDYKDIRKQIQSHKQIFQSNFSGNYSKGIFPPENAFSNQMIPALKDEGLEWVLVDNIHFERAAQGYPFSTSGNLYEPNKADVRNPNPNDWVQLTGLWAPTKVSARWSRQPHYAEYINPNTGVKSKIIVVPADRYLGNEDGRGGFGALNYEAVMSQLESYNTNPSKPILIVLAHDGDNYGGGSESYYNNNFQSFVNWLLANPNRFVCTTIQDYLQMFPPDSNDVIHVEPGSWSGADNGDPEFKKWLGDPDASGYSPDRNSWAVITATKNILQTAEQINSTHPNLPNAWKYYLNAQTSCYWYWDGAQGGIWDSHPTRACNQTVQFALPIIGLGTDVTGPTIFLPQREPYNPGATEWGITQPSNFTVWTNVFDIKGIKSVKLKYRLDLDGVNSNTSTDNETYAGGSEVTAWNELEMIGRNITPQTNPSPLYKAKEYSAEVTGINNSLIDYYVEAIDSNNNISRSPIQHVWVGAANAGSSGVSWFPTTPNKNDTITISVNGVTQGAKLHWGVNNVGSSWQSPHSLYWPNSSYLFNGTGPAVESPMFGPDINNKLTIKLGPFNNQIQSVARVAFVIHFNDNTWDNNNGNDYHITISDGSTGQAFIMDGIVDTSARLVASNSGLNLYLAWNGTELYTATQSAQSQNGDVFIIVSDSTRPLRNAPWAKNGKVSTWKAYLGNESTNNWSGWFNHNEAQITSGVSKYAGSYLEGTMNILNIFGYLPAKIYVAVGKYQTNDGGILLTQVPIGNSDANIDPNELYAFDYTFALPIPSTPVLMSPSNQAVVSTTNITFSWLSSNYAQSYHLQISLDTNFTNKLIDDSTIIATSRQVDLSSAGSIFYWRVRSINYSGASAFTRHWKIEIASQFALKMNVSAGWNLISVPLKLQYTLKDSIFKSAVSPAYAYSNAYVKKDSIFNMLGYWLKYETPQEINLNGISIISDSVDVVQGWNLIGSISQIVLVDSIRTRPAGIINSNFYGYNSVYFISDTISPGKAYWVKVRNNGKLFLRK